MQAASIQTATIAEPVIAPDQTPASVAPRTYFSGLDSLRFYAALLVLIGHIHLNKQSVGLPDPNYGAIFYRGAPSVSFFFTLSGFLITYLLLDEHARTGAISVRAFLRVASFFRETNPAAQDAVLAMTRNDGNNQLG